MENCCIPMKGKTEIKSLKYSKVLSTSIEDDKHRREVDDAKKRAVAQNVDYPAFAAMVSAAHLKPVDQKSLRLPRKAERKSPAWSFDSSGNLINLAGSRNSNSTQQVTSTSKDCVYSSLSKLKMLSMEDSRQNHQHPPITRNAPSRKSMTGDAFKKIWNKLAKESHIKKLEFLSTIAPSSFQAIFKIEIPPDILVEILETLHEHLKTGGPDEIDAAAEQDAPLVRGKVNLEVLDVLRILDSIAKCPRFSIAVKLMKHKSSSMVNDLFDLILTRMDSSSSCDSSAGQPLRSVTPGSDGLVEFKWVRSKYTA